MTMQYEHKAEEPAAAVMAEVLELKARLDKLGKERRRSWWVLLPVVVSLVIALSVIVMKPYDGRWWAIHDRDGHTTAWFDDQGLQLKDANGRVRAKFGLFPAGSPYLQFFDEANHIRAQLFVYTDGSGYLMTWDKNGKGARFPPSESPMP